LRENGENNDELTIPSPETTRFSGFRARLTPPPVLLLMHTPI
jgi:hypothetical protein